MRTLAMVALYVATLAALLWLAMKQIPGEDWNPVPLIAILVTYGIARWLVSRWFNRRANRP